MSNYSLLLHLFVPSCTWYMDGASLTIVIDAKF